MKKVISKLFAVAVVAATMASAAAPALAGGGYYWTDISSLIAERQNRPVWAMAYASPYWYMTDGQDLWSGGHVWRTEGSAMADITTDVRNAGLSRVDDIVSDGQTVLFLKGITAKNNSFQVLKYNGTYTDVSYTLRNQLSSDEGIISLNGKSGMWAFVTTQGRVFLWNTGNNTVTGILNSTVNYPDYLNYSVYGTSPSTETGFFAFAVPVSNGWFIGQRQGSYSSWGNMRLWLRDLNGNLTDVTSKFSTFQDAEFMASNGNTAIFLARNTSGSSSQYTARALYSFDGVNKIDLSSQYYNADSTLTWFRAIAAYDGSSWLVAERGDTSSDRSVLQISGSNVSKLSNLKDYLIDMASNGNGTILLGGAESEMGKTDPNSPLMAKLFKASTSATNSNGTTDTNTYGGGGTYSSSNGPTVTTSGNPANYQLSNGGTFTYRASAWDTNGVNRVSLYVDGSLAKTCYSDTCEYSNVYYSNSLTTRSVPMYAIAMDNQGYTTQTSQETLTVGQGTSNNDQQNSQQDSNSGTYYWSYLNPDQTYLTRGNSMTYNVGANDSDGINRIEIVVNGATRKTCTLNNWTGNQSCAYTLNGYDYLLNSQIAVNAKIVDGAGKETWTALKYINVTDSSYNTNDNSGDVSAWGWFDPSNSSLNRGSSTTYKIQANATQGLQKVEIYADGSLKRTCNFSRAYGTQSCDFTVYGNDYTVAQHTFNARATDYYGKTSWSDTKTLTIQDANNSNTSGNGVYTWSWLDPSNTTLQRGSSATYRTQASADNGLQRIDVYVNGTVKRTCNFSRSYGTQNCDLTIYGNDYSTNSQLAINAKSTDYNGYTNWSSLTYLTITDTTGNSTDNGSVGLQADPNRTSFNNGDWVTFNGSAQDPDGLTRIEILIDGSVVKTCNYSNSTAWENCSYSSNLYSNNGKNSRTIGVSVKAYDRYGYVRGVNPIYYNINAYDTSGNGSNSDTGSNPATWSWSEPNEKLNLTTAENVTYHVGAWDQDGLKRIEMWVNGMLAHTCYFNSSLAYGNQECTFTVNGSNYKAGDAIYVNAKAVDAFDHEGWSPARTYTVVNQDSQLTTSNIGKLTAWSSSDAGYGIMDAITFWTKGSDNDGISKIEIIVNAQTVKTCYNTDSCSIVGGPYSGRSYITYGAKMTDKLGNVTYSGYKTIYKK